MIILFLTLTCVGFIVGRWNAGEESYDSGDDDLIDDEVEVDKGEVDEVEVYEVEVDEFDEIEVDKDEDDDFLYALKSDSDVFEREDYTVDRLQLSPHL